jgi:hypothetical protein
MGAKNTADESTSGGATMTDDGAQTLDGDQAETPGLGDVYEALSNRRRRFALHHLKQLDGDQPVDISTISTQVAAWENGSDPEQLGYADRKNVHTSLYQFHVPKMDDLGLVNYDRNRGTVELTQYGRDVDVYLEAVYDREIPWSTYFLMLSGVMTGVAVAAWADAPLFDHVSDASWTLFVAVTFLISSAAYAYSNRSMRVGSEGTPPEIEEE